ncbi:uncharacterized protein LOC128307931 [Anopheles moucheti]|uniref:uncharacterized protein LOC128307931 n=1 Tax=Anopheles moucheti TaxID=186751 RepID=UPI0022EFF6C3|nr:uncharacterized protein LOC128307931 [Anopheles moucheti]
MLSESSPIFYKGVFAKSSTDKQMELMTGYTEYIVHTQNPNKGNTSKLFIRTLAGCFTSVLMTSIAKKKKMRPKIFHINLSSYMRVYLLALPSEFALANVTCEYQSNTQTGPQDTGSAGRRVRRSEEILKQAAEFVSRGDTFQNVSIKFDIPISTIRFYMARKGILPQRKRGRTAMYPGSVTSRQQMALMDLPAAPPIIQQPNQIDVQQYNQQLNENMIMADRPAQSVSTASVEKSALNVGSRSPSPSGPPFHFANYKLPDLRPDLL